MIDRDVSFETETPRVERADVYSYDKFTEGDNPNRAYLARKIHAAAYLGEGFINPNAITETGELVAELDKLRGDGVEYYIGQTKDEVGISTIRKGDAQLWGGFEFLPGYKLCADVISPEAKATLVAAEAEGRPIKEIGAFGHIPEVSSEAGLEILRDVIQEAQGTDEVWFFSMVAPKLKKLQYIFGPLAIRSIGEAITINDERTKGVQLAPAYVDMRTFYDDIYAAIVTEPDARKRERYVRYLRYFTEGYPSEKLSEAVQNLIKEKPSFNFTFLQDKSDEETSNEWSPPQPFDMKNPVDSAYARRLVEDGAKVVDSPWDEGSDKADATEGVWFHYPWNKQLVHFPDEAEYKERIHRRDRGLVTEEEQATLYGKQALYMGLSVGSHVLSHMTRAGVGGSHVLADPDTLSLTNLNRLRAGMAQAGERKVDVFAKQVSEHDPYTELTLLRDGVTEESLAGLSRVPDIIFDAADDFYAKARIRLYAQENKVPLIMPTDVGSKSIIDIERHDLEGTRLFNGRLNQKTIEAMLRDELTPEERMKVMVKLIGLSNASFRLLQSVSDPSLEGIPQLDVTASQGGALATTAARDILLGRDVPSGRHVHDARRSMRLPREMPLRDGLAVVQNFLAKR